MINEGAGARNEISCRWKSWTRNKKGDRKKKRRRFLYLIMEKQCTPRCSTCHVHSTNNWFGGREKKRDDYPFPFHSYPRYDLALTLVIFTLRWSICQSVAPIRPSLFFSLFSFFFWAIFLSIELIRSYERGQKNCGIRNGDVVRGVVGPRLFSKIVTLFLKLPTLDE